VSIALHAAALAALGHVDRWWQRTSPLAWGDALVLQAVLAGPETPPVVDTPPPMTTVAEAPIPAPPLPEIPKPRPSGPSGIEQSAPKATAIATPGTPDPPISITVGWLDPAQLGDAETSDLAQQYPALVAKRPQLRSALNIFYPRDALDARREAHLVVVMTIDEAGAITSQRYLPDDGVFRPAVETALAKIRFAPAELDGQFIAYWAIMRVDFVIPDHAQQASRLPDRAGTPHRK
jgi:hypothetical protein